MAFVNSSENCPSSSGESLISMIWVQSFRLAAWREAGQLSEPQDHHQ